MEQERTSGIPVTLPPMGKEITPKQKADRSETRWGWTCYRDISNLAPWGIKSQIGYRDQRWTLLKRCTPYPLGNLVSYDVDREAAELNAGFNTNSEHLPKIEYIKYALDQAEELENSYRDSGFRVLTPLRGMNDAELVNQIVQVVQPFTYAIHEMRYEFTEGAESRIRASNLSTEDKQKAYELAKVMLGGAIDPLGSAEVKALAEYEALISSMSDKSVGQPGISNPNKFHEWICEQLGKEIPKRVDRTTPPQAGVGTDPVLMNHLLNQQKELAEMKANMNRPQSHGLVKRRRRTPKEMAADKAATKFATGTEAMKAQEQEV